MRFTCNRPVLAEVAGLVGQAVAAKSTKRIFECLRIDAKGQAVEIVGTDLDVAARYRLDEGIDVEREGAAVVPAALFAGILREIGDETVTLAVAKRKMSIETDGGHFEIECEDETQYPEIPAFPSEATGEVAVADFRALVRKTVFAAGREPARFVLNGVQLIAEGGDLRFVATDGRRLATVVKPMTRPPKAEGKPVSAIVGVKGLQHFEKAVAGVEGAVHLALTDRFVAVRTPRAEVTARIMDGAFPPYDQILPKECAGEASVPIGMFASRLRQVGQFTSVESQSVVVSFREGELGISAAGGNGRADVRMGVEYEGPEEKIGFNPGFLLDALKVADGDRVRIGITNRNSAAKVTEDGGLLYVVMPVLID
jgi:DNA polymerase-3 subunit beta